MRKWAGWKLGWLLMATVAVLAAGCGKQSVTGEGVPEGREPGNTNEDGEETAAMGRYVEEEIDLSEELQVP